MGEDSCYSLAFGIPAILMFLALGRIFTEITNILSFFQFLVSFFVGSRSYKKAIPDRNIVTLFFKVSWVGSVQFSSEYVIL